LVKISILNDSRFFETQTWILEGVGAFKTPENRSKSSKSELVCETLFEANQNEI
jgi:hypothetical protein